MELKIISVSIRNQEEMIAEGQTFGNFLKYEKMLSILNIAKFEKCLKISACQTNLLLMSRFH